MTQRVFNLLAGVLFSVVAALHALRLLLHWEAVIGGWVVPSWVSIAGLCVAGVLTLSAFSLNRK